MSELTIKDKFKEAADWAKKAVDMVATEGIQLPITIKIPGCEVYVNDGYQDKALQVSFKWETYDGKG